MVEKNHKLTKDKVKEKKTEFSPEHFVKMAEYITDTWATRKRARKDEEKVWKEIDRQIAMEPDIGFKTTSGNAGSKVDIDRAWMPELELPLQAQTLEVLTSDARRFMFPGDKPWFESHTELTDSMLARAAKIPLIAGDTTGLTSQMNQDNMDAIVTGTVDHYHDQYDFQSNIDLVNGDTIYERCFKPLY